MGDGVLTLNELGPFSFQRKDIFFNQHCGLILSCANVFIDWNWLSGERCDLVFFFKLGGGGVPVLDPPLIPVE